LEEQGFGLGGEEWLGEGGEESFEVVFEEIHY